MKVIDEVFDKMIDSLKKNLSSFHSHRRRARIYAKRFLNGFSDNDREFIVKEILHQQNRSLIKAIGNKKNIAIPFIGSYQYRESLEIIRKIKNEVKEEMGIDDLRKVDPVIYKIANEKIEFKKKAILLPLYFKQLNIKGNTVINNFLNKDSIDNTNSK